VAALGVGLCVLAGAFGAAALYVPGVALLLLALAAGASVGLAGRRARISREPPRATVEEGVSLRLAGTVTGVRLARGTGALARWPGAPFTSLVRLPRGRFEFSVRPERRGAHVVGPSVLRFRDPFSICSRTLLSPETELLVLPRVEPIDPRALARVSSGERRTSPRSRGAAVAEVDGLRPYRAGAPASRIHWPTVARTGTLAERQLQQASDRLPLVVLDARRPVDLDALDKCVRAAAALCVGLAERGGCSVLLPGEQRTFTLAGDLAAWPALHARLALLQPGGALSWSRIERAELVLWVSASRQASPRVGGRGASCFLVSPFAHPGRTVLFAVAGCAVQEAAGAALARAS
jgi:uncharacterized protein (DUF58 family)